MGDTIWLKEQDVKIALKALTLLLELKPAVLLALLVKPYLLVKVHLSVTVLGVSKVRKIRISFKMHLSVMELGVS